MVRFISVLLALTAASGCVPSRHKMESYRSDPELAQHLSFAASAKCLAHRGATDQPPHPFTTDGCSLVPDGSWGECCVEHDISYWCGGSADDRRRADRVFGECVAESGGWILGKMMGCGVRIGGIPWQPASYRWAYGWDGIRGYEVVASPVDADMAEATGKKPTAGIVVSP